MHSQEKYEIEYVPVDTWDDECLGLIAMLTGYELTELREKLEPRLLKSCGWYARDFRETFTKLGFDCSPRFKAFDPATPYPCLMRFTWKDEKGKDCWSVVVYYDDTVYDPMKGVYHRLAQWQEYYPHCKVTSMMQVWISNL